MALITREKMVTSDTIEQKLFLEKELLDQLERYISLTNIEYGIVRNGTVGTTAEDKREYLIIEMIKRVLKDDASDLRKLENKSIESTVEPRELDMKNIIDQSIKDLANSLEESITPSQADSHKHHKKKNK